MVVVSFNNNSHNRDAIHIVVRKTQNVTMTDSVTFGIKERNFNEKTGSAELLFFHLIL